MAGVGMMWRGMIGGVVCTLALGVAGARADIRLPAILGSNMVLQQDADVVLWGWAEPKERVKALPDWTEHGSSAVADDQGHWRMTIRTLAYGTGKGSDGKPLDPFKTHSITISGNKSRVTLSNLLIGEVWVCSGQSNMEMPVGDHGGGYRGVEKWQQEAPAARFPGIRFFDLQNTISSRPEDDCKPKALGGSTPGWIECTPATVVDFSAVGYFFGRELRRTLDVPIGLVSADWGGTPAEAWTSVEALAAFPEYAETLAWLKTQREGKDTSADEFKAWWTKAERIDNGKMSRKTGDWSAPGFDDSAWVMARLPWAFAGDLASFDGLVWFRRVVGVPEECKGKDLTLSLGPIDDMDTVYWDGGRMAGTETPGHWADPRTYTIPADRAKPGTHLLAIRVLDTGGAGGFAGTPEQMFLQGVGGDASSRVRLDGYWRYSKSAAMSELPPMEAIQPRQLTAGTPSALYNGMIAPLGNLAIRGAIWYQGESNRGNAEQYARLFPAMITDWRKQWGRGDFPFYFVQIAPFRYGGDKGETAALREAQRQTLALPNTGMAVTMDIGNPDDIHPSNKQDVGKRLALWALAKTYGKKDVECSGPLATSVEALSGGGLRVKFDHAAGLKSRGGEIGAFEVAGADGAFVPATAQVADGVVVVRSEAVKEPRQVRYGWCNDCAPTLCNGAGLPAVPFAMAVGGK